MKAVYVASTMALVSGLAFLDASQRARRYPGTVFSRAVWTGLLAGVLAIACDDSNDRPSGVGSGAGATTAGSDTGGGAEGGESPGAESSFLVYCDTSSSCGERLRCISGVCTLRCGLGEADCTALTDAATCTDGDGPIDDEFVAICDVGCSGDADCLALGEDHRCDEGGFCRAGTSSGTGPSGHPHVFPCPAGDIAGDAFDYRRHRIKGDLLEIQIGYWGGARPTRTSSGCATAPISRRAARSRPRSPCATMPTATLTTIIMPSRPSPSTCHRWH